MNVPEISVQNCDVLIIGGGPAGSTAATLLARKGHNVVLLEKDEHPRFHIGESLLPCNLPLLRELGVLEQVQAMGIYKPGAEFVVETGEGRQAFPFHHAIGAQHDHAYQVLRADFDELLFRNAAQKGAKTFENIKVTQEDFQHGASTLITAQDKNGIEHRFSARFVLDASGRDGFLATRKRRRNADKNNSTAAIYSHFRKVPRRGAGMEGYISIHLVKEGWFWMIPLPDGIMSVGFVGDKSAFRQHQGPAIDLFWQKVQESPSVAERMAHAELLHPLSTTGNYSYRADQAWGEGYYMIGDAYAFLDPVFSSGVLLAMKSAFRGADVAEAWLRSPQAGAEAARAAELQTCKEMRRISWLIYRINNPVLRKLFMNPRNILRMRDAVISLLAGDFAAGWRVGLPITAFKAVFDISMLKRKMGLKF